MIEIKRTGVINKPIKYLDDKKLNDLKAQIFEGIDYSVFSDDKKDFVNILIFFWFPPNAAAGNFSEIGNFFWFSSVPQ